MTLINSSTDPLEGSGGITLQWTIKPPIHPPTKKKNLSIISSIFPSFSLQYSALASEQEHDRVAEAHWIV